MHDHDTPDAAGARPLVVLHIGAVQTVVTVGAQAQPAQAWTLPIGADQLAHAHFDDVASGSRLRALAIEQAIADVEDQVMPLGRQLPPEAHLVTRDAGVAEIAALAGVSGPRPMRLSVDAVEQVFNRWVAIAAGRPVTQDRLSDSGTFAARLLMLREILHHWPFTEILVVEGEGGSNGNGDAGP